MNVALPRRAWLVVLLAALPGCVPPAAAPPPAVPEAIAPVSVDATRFRPEATIGTSIARVPGLTQLAREAAVADATALLDGAGPYTLFAPTDAAYARLAGDVPAALLAPENRATLLLLLRDHLVAGAVSEADLVARIRAGGGRATLTSLAGQPIVATLDGDVVMLTSSSGSRAYIETADRRQANGVIHVINGVLVPTLTK
ncbi:fasciclin domain-containing protein [Sphingomonas sp. XXL09]|uniref:fasciclin domain-containing protein n=1 Tax=Sphingomonas sp. XXL09 TaxID=3457787 RepID=UPI00406BA974